MKVSPVESVMAFSHLIPFAEMKLFAAQVEQNHSYAENQSTKYIGKPMHTASQSPDYHKCCRQTTQDIEHMPEDHQKYLEWNGDRFRKWAANIRE